MIGASHKHEAEDHDPDQDMEHPWFLDELEETENAIALKSP